MNAKNSGVFLRYSKVLEEILYSEDNLYGSRVQIPRCSFLNSEVSRMKSSIIARCDWYSFQGLASILSDYAGNGCDFGNPQPPARLFFGGGTATLLWTNRDSYHRLTRVPVEDNLRRKLGHFYFIFAIYLAARLA